MIKFSIAILIFSNFNDLCSVWRGLGIRFCIYLHTYKDPQNTLTPLPKWIRHWSKRNESIPRTFPGHPEKFSNNTTTPNDHLFSARNYFGDDATANTLRFFPFRRSLINSRWEVSSRRVRRKLITRVSETRKWLKIVEFHY